MKFQSYPWYFGRLANTSLGPAGISGLEERGLYRELLDFCYVERSLPTDERSLARIANCSDDEFERAWPRVKILFNEANGRLIHHKVDEVLVKLDGYAEQKRQAGRLSGESRRNKTNVRSSPVQFSLPKNPNEKRTGNEPSLPALPSIVGQSVISCNSEPTDRLTREAEIADAVVSARLPAALGDFDQGLVRDTAAAMPTLPPSGMLTGGDRSSAAGVHGAERIPWAYSHHCRRAGKRLRARASTTRKKLAEASETAGASMPTLRRRLGHSRMLHFGDVDEARDPDRERPRILRLRPRPGRTGAG